MIGIYLGEQNSGKTLSMVYHAYRYYKKGYTTYSNFKLNFPHKILTKEILLDYTKKRKQFKNTNFLIDELYLFMDSRNFGSKNQKIFSYMILQSSKAGCNVFGTAQYFNTVEKRFRDNTSFSCFCNRVKKIKPNKYKLILEAKRFLKDSSKLYIQNVFMIKRSYDMITPHFETKKLYIKAEPIFKLYDTTELIGIE